MDIFSSKRSIFILSALKDSPLNYAFVVKKLVWWCKYRISCGKKYLKKQGDLVSSYWSILKTVGSLSLYYCRPVWEQLSVTYTII